MHTPIYFSQFYNATISTHTANEIHSSSDKLTFRIIGSSRMPSSYQFFGLLSDIVDDSYGNLSIYSLSVKLTLLQFFFCYLCSA